MIVVLAIILVLPIIWLLVMLIRGRGKTPYSTGGTPLPPISAAPEAKRTYGGLGWP